MTVSVNSRRREYDGNGVATVFNGPMAYAASHVQAFLLTAGVLTLVPATDYVVEKLGLEAGTRVTMTGGAPAVGTKLLLLRLMPYSQDVDVTNQGSFHAETLEKGFDALAMQIQQFVDTALQLVFQDGSFAWDAQGNRITNVGDPIIDTDAVNQRVFLERLGDFISLGLNTSPKYWEITGDGVEVTFPIPGADVSDPLFYDVLVAGTAIEPFDGFNITLAGDTSGSLITFTVPPADLADCWVVLRGYAKPVGSDLFTNQEFIDLLTTLITNTLYESVTVLQLGAVRSLVPLVDVAGTAAVVDGTHESFLLRCTNAAATTLTVRANTGSPTLDFETNPVAAPYFSALQAGAGQVTLAADVGVTLKVPAGYLAKSRALNSIITATCDFAAGGVWTLSGDLAIDEAYVPGGALVKVNKVLAAAVSSNVTAAAVIGGWAFNVAAGKSYRIKVLGTYQSAATTTGGSLGILGGGGVAGAIAGKATGAISAAIVATALAVPISTVSGAGSSLTTTGVSAINTPHWIEMDAVFRCTTSGTLSITWASEVAASAAQLNVASGLFVEEVSITA